MKVAKKFVLSVATLGLLVGAVSVSTAAVRTVANVRSAPHQAQRERQSSPAQPASVQKQSSKDAVPAMRPGTRSVHGISRA